MQVFPRSRLGRCCLLVALGCLVLTCVGTGASAARTPGYEQYGANEGLSSGEVVSVVEDREGYLWAATFAADLHRFDGRVFERFGAQQGLTSQRIKRIHIDREGRIRVATLAGLFLFAQDRFVADPQLADTAVYDVLQTQDGALWFATEEGAVRIDHGRVLRLGVREGLPMAHATALAEGPGGEVWIGTTRGLARFHNGTLTQWQAGHAGLRDDYITRLLVDKAGGLWVATDRGLAHFVGQQFSTLDLGVGARRLYVLDLLQDRKGQLRIATLGQGVLSWDGSTLRQLGIGQGLPSSNVWSLATSSSGGLWIGTQEHGLLLRPEGPFELVLPPERLAHAASTQLLRDKDGDLWVATAGAGVLRIGDLDTVRSGPQTPLESISYVQGLPSDIVRRLLWGAAGLWIGTNAGVAHWDRHHLTVLDPKREPWPVRGLLEDADGSLWMVNKEQGLVHYRQRTSGAAGATGTPPDGPWEAERFPAAPEPTPCSLWSMASVADGALWLGATSALVQFDGQRFLRWEAPTLSRTDRIVQLVLDPQQRLWFRSDEAIGYVDRQGPVPRWAVLPLPRVAWLSVSPQGEVLAAAEDGIYHLQASQGPVVTVRRVVSAAEGYPRSTPDADSHLWRSDGTLLFGTADGVFRYDPSRALGPPGARVHLRRLLVNGQPLPLPDASHALQLRPQQNSLTVVFDATAFPAPERIEFRYRLAGHSPRFSPPSPGRMAVFQNLPPGRYMVHVQARHGGDWGPEVVSGVIQVLPAYWQTWWFQVGIGAVALAMALAVPLFRAKQLQRQRDALEQVVAQRTAELTRYSGHLEDLVQVRTHELEQTYRELLARKEAHSRAQEALATTARQAALGRMAGVVAHQVNTPLAAIKARLSLLRDDPQAGARADNSLSVIDRQVDRIARIVRVLLGFVRQRERAEECPLLSGVVQSVVDLYAEAFRAQRVTLAVVLPAEPLAVRGAVDDLQELLLNLVENAREAVSAGGAVHLVLARQQDHLRLTVEDDGPGLGESPEQLFQPFFTTKTTGTGLGLAISRRIAEALHGTLTAENRFADGRGARFVLTLPLANPPLEPR